MGENKRRERERDIDSARLPLFVLTEKQFPASRRRTVNVLAGVQYCLFYIIPRREKKERERERRGARGSMSRDVPRAILAGCRSEGRGNEATARLTEQEDAIKKDCRTAFN